MKTAVLALLLAAGIPAHATCAGQPDDKAKVLQIELSIPAPVHEVWQAFTTEQGLTTWLAPSVSVDLKPGGDWLVKFPGSTGGGTIVSFVPEKEIVINALAPDRFPNVRVARTRAVFTFTPAGGSTLVRLTQTGWQSGAEWDAAYEYLAGGNAQLLAMLHHRFVAGPTDWQKAMAIAPKPVSKGEKQ
ncbi:SRPBCC family protein [Occallatibacter riparius]|uniref:SRPBCC domain-containing protein n=1 Tax=Occallatibacter riparius TaxID=1002689 RepID=A0A9J7BMH5_9BACT|nr:SRPBCC domain-containing protein [Occallatibacter riparius]UWZ82397.1 SRPBCC domain-containing protein [Occallatibacter riparius]